MREEITITIDAQGNVEVSVKGVKGQGCKALTREIEKALGKVTADKKTREYHEKPRTNKLRLGG